MERNSRIGDTLLSTTVFPWDTLEEVEVTIVDDDNDVDISITVDCFPNSVLLSSIVRARFVGLGDTVLCLRLEWSPSGSDEEEGKAIESDRLESVVSMKLCSGSLSWRLLSVVD